MYVYNWLLFVLPSLLKSSCYCCTLMFPSSSLAPSLHPSLAKISAAAIKMLPWLTLFLLILNSLTTSSLGTSKQACCRCAEAGSAASRASAESRPPGERLRGNSTLLE